MTLSLSYGIDSALELPDAGEQVAHVGRPGTVGLADPQAETARVLAEPLDFPPLSQTAIPGDHVVLALDAQVPQAASVVAAIIEQLTTAGVEPKDICLLRSPLDLAGDPLAKVPEKMRGEIAVEVHDPTDRKRLSYLAATRGEHRVYLNRSLTDADVVLPLGVLRFDPVFGYHGVSTGLYPMFSDTETQTRFWGKALVPSSPGETAKARAECDEVGWLLGVQFVVQVIAGARETASHILAGEARSVFAAGCGLVDQTWEVTIPRQAKLVVATVCGPAVGQTWQSLARALAVASTCVADGGSIVLCTALGTELGKLGPALSSLAGGENHESLLKRMLKHPSEDSFAATEIIKALTRSKVFLISGLEPQVVEDLGLAPVRDGAEVARLVERTGEHLVLENAPHLRIWKAAK
jgi:nickel-dependent lactate racemase